MRWIFDQIRTVKQRDEMMRIRTLLAGGRSERYVIREMKEKPTRNALRDKSKARFYSGFVVFFVVFFFSRVRSVCAPFLCHFYPKEEGAI